MLSELPARAALLDTLEPSLIIFHVSRCGSTLASQLIGLDDQFITLSEVPFFDHLLRSRLDDEVKKEVDVKSVLPAAIRLYGQRRSGRERHLVIKLDSWHTAFHSELRAMFPRTPFVLLYRHPAAVVASHRVQPGLQAVPGLLEPELFGMQQSTSSDHHPHEHLPRVLSFLFREFAKIARSDPNAHLFSYQADMIGTVGGMLGVAGLEISKAHGEGMAKRQGWDAKRPMERFAPKSDQYGEAPVSMAECLEHFWALDSMVKA
jgi:hypothetical protein